MLTTLHKKEMVLSNRQAKNLFKAVNSNINKLNIKKENDIVNTPTKESYENALDIVKRYEERQKQLEQLKKDLSYKLSKFTDKKFKINKKDKEVIFTGVIDGKLVVGKSICAKDDKYEDVIGKLIAVKKALNEDITDVVKLVERKYVFRIDGSVFASEGIYCSSGSVTYTP